MNKRNIFQSLIITALVAGFIFLPLDASHNATGQAQDSKTYYYPLFRHDYQPLAATSYYMTTLDSNYIYSLGCKLGTRDAGEPGAQDNVAVLDFSYPICNDTIGFGADLFGYGPASIADVANATKQFALGYYTCSGVDVESNLVIGVGTNNKPTSCNTTTKATAHGKAWANLLTNLNQWAQNAGIFHQVQFYGASNMELGWNSPEWTRDWIAGFEEIGNTFLFNFGDAAGCPYEDKPTYNCGTSAFPEWEMEDVWFISWGSPSALPLPLIYLTNGVHAKQWAYLSQYSVSQHGHRMDFTGVFTQYDYCQQFTWCDGTDNSPEQAYQQLTDELNKYPSTAQILRWKTDIHWILQNEITSPGVDLLPNFDEITSHPVENDIAALRSDLQTPSLSQVMSDSLEHKLQIYESLNQNIQISQTNPAPKNAPIRNSTSNEITTNFRNGITEGGAIAGLPYAANITTTWQDLTAEGYLQVAAGSAPERPQQGVLYALLLSPDATAITPMTIFAPDDSGPLSIVERTDDGLLIGSESGQWYMLDLENFVLMAVGE